VTATSAARVPAAALLEVVRHRTHAIAEEMRSDLMRSARSTVIREAGDLSCAITDPTGGTVAQGNDIPMHLGVLGFTVRELLARVSTDLMGRGTVFFVNLPAVGGNHLPDVKAIRPVFADGALVAFAVALAHWPDVGGALPGSYVPDAVEIYQEGLQIPPTRLFDADGERDEPLALILANLRDPERRRGDIRAQAATTGIAERRIAELVQRLGRDAVIGAWEAMQAESERRLRHALAELPDGVWTGQDALDDDGVSGDQVPIRCTLTIRGDQAEFDYGQSSPQTAGPVNTTRFITAASTLYAVKATLAPAAEVNAGLARPLVIRTERGTVCDAGETASLVAGNHETSQRIADAAFQALAQVVPDRVPAAGMGSSGLALFSGQRGGSTFVLYETHAGGSGALPDRDGDSATRIHMSNVMNTPAEVIEAEYPLRVLTAQLRARSGGDGRHRGGDGLRRRYAVLEAGVRLTTMVERCTVAPPGLDGGGAGSPSSVWLVRGGRRQRLPGKGSVLLERDDIIEVETAGGGGHGEPRDKELTP
jgi:N-methylhydantoinase B